MLHITIHSFISPNVPSNWTVLYTAEICLYASICNKHILICNMLHYKYTTLVYASYSGYIISIVRYSALDFWGKSSFEMLTDSVFCLCNIVFFDFPIILPLIIQHRGTNIAVCFVTSQSLSQVQHLGDIFKNLQWIEE